MGNMRKQEESKARRRGYIDYYAGKTKCPYSLDWLRTAYNEGVELAKAHEEEHGAVKSAETGKIILGA